MSARKPLLIDAVDWLEQKPGDNLPAHDFHIGENGSADISQLPKFRAMAFHVVGKAPMVSSSVAWVDRIGTGVIALGGLIADAGLKLMRPSPLKNGERYVMHPGFSHFPDFSDGWRRVAPAGDLARIAFYCRIGEFLEIALHQPQRLPAIIANIDALTNARLTERAREVLTTGIDPGADDLWVTEIETRTTPTSQSSGDE